MMITKYRETYSIQYCQHDQPLHAKTVQYLYDCEEAREIHRSAMLTDGFLETEKKIMNLGDIEHPDYRVFAEYIKQEYKPEINLVDKKDVIRLLENYLDLSIVDLTQIIPLVKQLPEAL